MKQKILSCLLLLTFLAVAFVSPLAEGLELKRGGRYSEALDVLMEKRSDHYSSEWIQEVAEILERMQNDSMAAFYYQEMLNNFPDSKYAESAKEKLKGLIQNYKDSDLTSLSIDLEGPLSEGQSALKNQDYHAAILHLLRAHSIKPDDHYTLFLLGSSYYGLHLQTGQKLYVNRAIDQYRKASYLYPSAKTFNNLACLLARQKDIIMARYYFEKAIKSAEVPGLKRSIEANLKTFEKGQERELVFLLMEP
ncbi:MAG: hypothetical protein H3C47_15020 [Candidatus Cloacimonetes bacterium]|nr:hypothetical protein [Candidatus Cloacimonadota bacterium]